MKGGQVGGQPPSAKPNPPKFIYKSEGAARKLFERAGLMLNRTCDAAINADILTRDIGPTIRRKERNNARDLSQ